MKIHVNFEDERWKKYKIDFKKIVQTAVGGDYDGSEISITLTNDKKIRALNKKYRNINKPTNVLSFELRDPILLGEIFISLDTTLKEAKKEKISVEDHTAHLVVHGILHLLGYDHLDDRQAEVMENKEIKILKKLGIENPYEKNKTSKVGVFLRYVILFILGGIAALGFAPWYFWWATLIAIGLAYWIITRIQSRPSWFGAFWRIFPFSAAYSLVMFGWMINSIYVVPELTAKFAIWTIPALVGIALIGGIMFAIPFVVIQKIKIFPAARSFIFAATWGLVLWGREWLFTGFPWNPIANITLPFPALANSMSLFGALGLTFIIIGFVAAIVEVLRNKKSGTCWASLIIFIILGLVGSFFGHANINKAEKLRTDLTPTIRIIQPALSQSEKMEISKQDVILQAQLNMAQLMKLAKAGDTLPDLIVFPETSYPFVVKSDDVLFTKFLNVNAIIGATSYEGEKLYNSMLFLNRDGEIEKIYKKTHLVPFGEYSPLGFMPSPVHLSKGKGAEIVKLDLNGKEFFIAPAICYEIIFSDSLLPKNSKKVDAIINITNDTWFGKTSGPYQHLDMVRRYAIESGLPVIRANYSGISAFILSDGRILSELPINHQGWLDGAVWGAHKTAYRKIGLHGMMIFILLFSFVCTLVLAFVRKEEKI